MQVRPWNAVARCAAIAAAALVVPAAAAVDRQGLTQDCEIAVARSAAPERLRASAAVYAFSNGAYRKVVDGDGPLTCVVERNAADSLIPQCMDRGGVDSVLPAILFRSMMAVRGASNAEIVAASQEKLEQGEFEPLPGPGISYMMSAYNYIYVASAQRVLKVPPHVMFYAPDLSNADVGGSLQSTVTNPGTPVVVNQGKHGYMIVYTQYPADPDEVAEKCRGQIGEPPPLFNPFPRD
jgi:hypothetical protein